MHDVLIFFFYSFALPVAYCFSFSAARFGHSTCCVTLLSVFFSSFSLNDYAVCYVNRGCRSHRQRRPLVHHLPFWFGVLLLLLAWGPPLLNHKSCSEVSCTPTTDSANNSKCYICMGPVARRQTYTIHTHTHISIYGRVRARASIQ